MRRLAVVILGALLLTGCVHHGGGMPFDRVIIETDSHGYYDERPRYYYEEHHYYHPRPRYYYHDEGWRHNGRHHRYYKHHRRHH